MILKMYAIVIKLLSTFNKQDESTGKRKLDAFVDKVLDKSASMIADDILSNFPSIIKLSSTKLSNDAKLVDTEGTAPSRQKDATSASASAPTTPKPKKEAAKAETPAEVGFRKSIKEGDKELWNESPAQIPKKKLIKGNLFQLAFREKLLKDTKTNFNKNNEEQLIMATSFRKFTAEGVLTTEEVLPEEASVGGMLTTQGWAKVARADTVGSK